MTEIYGITLKGCKEFQGREGDGVQGNIYMDGKKVGWYNDRADGGEVEIDYDSKEIETEILARVDRFFERYPQEYSGVDLFFPTILTLMDYEKSLRKALKKGCNAILAQDALNSDFPNGCSSIIYFHSEVQQVDEIKKKYHLEEYLHLRVYSAPKDFCIKEEVR